MALPAPTHRRVSMNKKLVSAAVTAALLSAACVPAAQAQGSAELQELKAQLEALQKKVASMEEAQQKQAEVQEKQGELQDKTLDQVAQQRANVGDWVGRFQWKGDLRYRNETIDQEFVHSNRNRDRIRARFGFFARVNDTVRVEMQATTAER